MPQINETMYVCHFIARQCCLKGYWFRFHMVQVSLRCQPCDDADAGSTCWHT
eukprot:m.5333 g.5333  ORF g.5333 m.5333 type:complete len:52 (+) comp4924_c0_seq2:740-895(+)